jgi:preprotein translocase subunit YajC
MFDHLPLILAQQNKQPASKQGNTPAETGGSGTTTTTAPGTTGTAPKGKAKGAESGGFNMTFVMLAAGLVLMFVLMSGSQRKEKKKRKAMLSTLKKGDKVQTIGGIIGNIIEVKDSHVVVKVDENNNTRMKFSRSAVQGLFSDQDKESESSDKDQLQGKLESKS